MDNGVIVATREMIFVNSFESNFKDKDYVIYRFVDPETLNIYTGTNLGDAYEPGHTYECQLSLKRNKIVVVSAE